MNPILLETPRLLLKGITHEHMSAIFNDQTKEQIKHILGHRTEEEFLIEENKHRNGYSSYRSRFI